MNFKAMRAIKPGKNCVKYCGSGGQKLYINIAFDLPAKFSHAFFAGSCTAVCLRMFVSEVQVIRGEVRMLNMSCAGVSVMTSPTFLCKLLDTSSALRSQVQ